MDHITVDVARKCLQEAKFRRAAERAHKRMLKTVNDPNRNEEYFFTIWEEDYLFEAFKTEEKRWIIGYM